MPSSPLKHRLSAETQLRYRLYEKSVQSPEVHVEMFDTFYREIRESAPRSLREDFCGTFSVSCQWVRSAQDRTALGLDLDPEPLLYGRQKHWSRLSPAQKKRIRILQKNVVSKTTPGSDVIVACNFSFCVFKQRRFLIDYFRSCLQSLSSKGILVLELAGGPGMIESMRERRQIPLNRKEKFTYIWDQKSFDPVSHDGHYAIHFVLKGKDGKRKRIENAFVYDWRMWTIPELRECLIEAGFPSTTVFWESEHQGVGTGEYHQTTQGSNDYAWISYIIGVR